MGSGISQQARDRIATCKKNGKMELNLSDCELKAIPKSRIRKFKNLKKLVICRNFLQVIHPDIRIFLLLEDFDVSTNEIHVPPPFFIYLNTINIKSIDSTT